MSVRKQDATTVISLTQGQDKDETEEDRVITAVLDWWMVAAYGSTTVFCMALGPQRGVPYGQGL